MADQSVQRRLAAILAADVAGYTRLMEEDTEGTVAAWQDARDDVVEPTVQSHSGRIVKLTGDGFLIEFPTVQDAVNCAISMQESLLTSSLDFRMGINLGDILDDGRDIHGEGVNVAARIEALAEPGGICISGSVHEQVRNRIDAGYEDMGEQTVKHVSAPVRVYQVRKTGNRKDDASPLPEQTISVLEYPAVAVLPFENLGGDPEQEYFADGLTDDITTVLSLWRSFPVISRNSSFAYKDAPLDIRRIGTELGARYLLEGSSRKAGDRVRITAQLIDATTGHHLWAEKYDRELTDIFALQDEITQRIVATVIPELGRAEQKRAGAKHAANLDAWDYYLKGLSNLHQYTKEGFVQARKLFEKAIELDPEYSPAWSAVALSHGGDMLHGFTDAPKETIQKAVEAAEKAVALDQSDSVAHLYLSIAHTWAGRDDAAIVEAEKAIALNPSNAYAYGHLGNVLDLVGRAEEGIPMMEQGLQLNPQDPLNHTVITFIARAYMNTRRYEEAVDWARKAISSQSKFANAHYILAISLSHLDKLDEARTSLQECDRIQPGFVKAWSKRQVYRNDVDNEHLLEGLHNTGWHKKAASGIAPADKPSIAVLPFDNLSGDPEQDYFADGMVEEIITGLSHIRWLTVIARNSSFIFKGQPTDVREVAEKLGVRYVMEGSVRKSGDRVRITAQLVEADAGGHLWADRFEGTLADVFDLQDQITAGVVAAIEPSVRKAEIDRAKRKRPNDLGAYDLYLRAIEHMYEVTPKGRDKSLAYIDQALAIDPGFAEAHGVAAWCYFARTLWEDRYATEFNDELLRHGYAVRDSQTEDASTLAHAAIALATATRQLNEPLAMIKRAIAINPSSAHAYGHGAVINTWAGNYEEAIAYTEKSLSLSPFDPLSVMPHAGAAGAHLSLGDNPAAVAAALKALEVYPTHRPANIIMIVALVRDDRLEEAQNALEKLLELVPNFSTAVLGPFVLTGIEDELAAAGLPVK